VENHASEENENKVIENYMLLLKESKALKTYIANVTKRQLNVTDFEKYGTWTFSSLLKSNMWFLEKELKKKYKSMTSSYSSKDSFNKEPKKEPVPTKKSLYAELNKEEIGENQTPHQEQEEASIDDQKCDLEPMNPNKPSPVCCNQCNIF